MKIKHTHNRFNLYPDLKFKKGNKTIFSLSLMAYIHVSKMFANVH